MKTIKIAHLYYDILNLYGENGNVRFLHKKLEDLGLNVEVHFLSLEDTLDFHAYDFYFIGSGTENNKKLVLNHLLEYKKDIKHAIEEGKFFLVTGNALDLFGKRIKSLDGTEQKALNVWNYTVTEEEFRIVGEQYLKCELLKENIIGFQNRCSVMDESGENFLEVIHGTGSNPSTTKEGIHEYNFYGTYTFGPLLVRNPYFTDYLVKQMCETLNLKYKEPNQEDASYKAYHEFIKNFYPSK